jgi:hypothetical protein
VTWLEIQHHIEANGTSCVVERQRGLPSPVGLFVIRVDRDYVATWAWRSKASSLKLHGRRRGSPRSARFCSSREHDDRGASHSFPACSSGRPVWLPLARREEITVVRTSPDLRSGAGSGRSPGVVVVGPIRRRPVRAENAVTSCDTYSCMRPPSRSRRSGRTGSTAPCHRSAQQRASVPVDQPAHLELRQVPELLATLAGCEHEPHRLRQQTPGDESERQRRRLVQPPAPPVSVSGASGVPQAPRHDGPQRS